MPRALPLAQFIGALSPQALQAGNQTTLESIYGQLGLDPRKLIGTTNSPLGPIRGLSPNSIPPGPRYMGVTVPGNYGVGGQGQLMEPAGQPGMGGLLSSMMQAQQKPGSLESPVQSGPQPPGNWDVQNMGDLPPGPVYPHVQPGVYPETAQNQYTPQQPTPQPPIVPRGTSDQQLPPWSYTPPAQTQQPQQGGISDAGMWGLIAAGLGILGNNYGNYGQWSPAVGKGGLIGVQTYLGQRQQAIDNQAQQQRLGIASREQAAREQLYGAQMGNYQSEAQLRDQQIENMKALRDAYSGILGDNPDQAKLMSEPKTHYAVAATLLRAGNPTAAKQAMDSGLALEKEQAGKWKTVMVPDGKGNETPMQVDEQGNTRPIQGAGSRAVFNPNPLVSVPLDIRTTKDFNQESATQQAKDLMDTYKTLQNIPDQLLVMEEAKKALAGAGGMVGSGAGAKLEIAKFFNNNFGTDIGANEVKNAELLRSTLFRQIMDNLKKLDAQPSQQQQKVMQESLGNLGTDPSAIPEIIRITEEVLKKRAQQHNQRVDQAIGNKAIFLYDIHIPGFDTGPKQKAPWER